LCFEVGSPKADEFADDKAVASSFDVDRDATTIEPVVSGQQLIALLCTGAGIANCVISLPLDCATELDRFAPLRLALQQACASIEPDMCAIACPSAAAGESISAIAPFA